MVYHGTECLLCRIAGRTALTPERASHPTPRDLFKSNYRHGHKRVLSVERYNRPSKIAAYLSEECDFIPIICRDLRLSTAVSVFNSYGANPDDIIFVIAPFFPQNLQIHPDATVVFVSTAVNSVSPGNIHGLTVSFHGEEELDFEECFIKLLKSRQVRYDQIQTLLNMYLPDGLRCVARLRHMDDRDCHLRMEC